MRVFAKAKIWQKIAIAFALIISLFIIAPEPVQADAGGELMKPICQFLVGIGDGIIDVTHQVMIKSGRTLIRIDVKTGILETVIVIIGSIVVCCLVMSLVIASMGTVTAPILALVGQVGTIASIIKGVSFVVALGTGVFASVWAYESGLWGEDEVSLPIYSITPEEIFKNDDEFPLLGVNFFKKDSTRYIEYDYSVQDTTDLNQIDAVESKLSEEVNDMKTTKTESEVEGDIDKLNYVTVFPDNGWVSFSNFGNANSNPTYDSSITDPTDINKYSKRVVGVDTIDQLLNQLIMPTTEHKENEEGEKYKRITAYYLPSGVPLVYQVIITDLDEGNSGGDPMYSNAWFGVAPRPEEMDDDGKYTLSNKSNTVEEKKERKKTSLRKGRIYPLSYQISDFVMSVYNALRIIAAVGMMTVLVYIGIRILISATSPKKAKYKQMLGDWLVGMVLLFTMHFIMYFANVFVDELSKFLTSINPCLYTQIIEDEKGKIVEALGKAGYNVVERGDAGAAGSTLSEGDINGKVVYTYTAPNKDGDIKTYVEWNTNLMGALRVRLNYNAYGDTSEYIGYTVMFLVMVLYTIIFLWTYIKRLIYIAFLTLIAPLVALTYPIDKVNDGKAQGFNYWFKEYIFNLLLQPLHLLIYTLLIGGAITFAAQNMIYGLVVLGFVASAEKIIRRMFNFQKSDTPGVFSGARGATLAMSGMKWLLGRGPRDNDREDSSKNEYTSKQGNATVQDRLKEFEVPDDSKDKVKELKEKNEDKTENKDKGIDKNYDTSQKEEGQEQANEKKTEEIIDGDDDSRDEKESKQQETKEDKDDEKSAEEDLPDSIEDYSDEQIEKYINDKASEARFSTQDNRYLKAKAQLNQLEKERTNWGDDSAFNGRRHLLNDFRHEEAERIAKENRKQKIKGYANKAKEKVGKGASGFARGMAGVGRNYLDKQSERFKRAKKDGLKRIGGVAAGATFGLAGMAAGIASGNPSQVLQNTTIGAAAGYKFGSNAAGSGANTLSDSKEAFERGRLGEEEYARRQAKKYQLEVANDEKTISKIQQKMKLSRREAKEKAREMVPKYMDAKVNDIEEMIKLEKFRTNKLYADKAGNMRHLKHEEVAQLEKLKKMYNMKLEDKEDKQNSITKNMMKDMKINGVNISESTAESWQKMTRDYMNFTEN